MTDLRNMIALSGRKVHIWGEGKMYDHDKRRKMVTTSTAKIKAVTIGGRTHCDGMQEVTASDEKASLFFLFRHKVERRHIFHLSVCLKSVRAAISAF